MAEALERGESAEAFDAALKAKEDGLDWLDALMGGGGQPTVEAAKTVAPLSLFESDYHYAREGLGYLHAQDKLANGPRLHPTGRDDRVAAGRRSGAVPQAAARGRDATRGRRVCREREFAGGAERDRDGTQHGRLADDPVPVAAASDAAVDGLQDAVADRTATGAGDSSAARRGAGGGAGADLGADSEPTWTAGVE